MLCKTWDHLDIIEHESLSPKHEWYKESKNNQAILENREIFNPSYVAQII